MSTHIDFDVFVALMDLNLEKTHTVAQRKRFVRATLKDAGYSARQLLDLIREEIKTTSKARSLSARAKAHRIEVLEDVLFKARRLYNATIGRAA